MILRYIRFKSTPSLSVPFDLLMHFSNSPVLHKSGWSATYTPYKRVLVIAFICETEI